jgi:hypothetical protein
MSMWDYITPRYLIDWQREAAFKTMGEEARQLREEGYDVDADRVLDEMAVRREAWRRELEETG